MGLLMSKSSNVNRNRTRNTALSAMFIAIGIVLPFFTGQIPQVGNLLLPMHFPVFLCGLVCGWEYGITVGFVLPLLRSAIFGIPILYPNALTMAIELATYGFVSGFLYNRAKNQGIKTIYVSIISAMISGRITWGLAQLMFLGIKGNTFTWQMFAAGAFFNAIPGIILQLVLIPAVISVCKLAGITGQRMNTNIG